MVVTDTEDVVYEHLNEGNNTSVSMDAISVVHPDLELTSVSVPAESVSGTAVLVDWTVTNIGTGATGVTAWVDEVYMSTDATLDGSDTLLAEFTHTGELAVGASYARQQQVVLPNGISGTYYVLVKTDAAEEVVETGSEGNNVGSAPTSVTLAPYADLVVDSVMATSAIVIGNPAQIDVSWTVRNQGSGVGPVDTWTDRIVVSANGVYGDGDDRLVSEFAHSGNLTVGETYTRSETISLPVGLSGQYHVFVKTDVSDFVYEYTFEANNVTPSAELISVRPTPFADLVISELLTPTSGNSGQPISVSWTVLNQGQGQTNASSWHDRIFLSLDNEIGNADDLLLASEQHQGVLSSESQYSKTRDVTLPEGIAGDYYIYVHADGTNVVDEFILEDNNTYGPQLLSVSLTPPPDLQVTTISAPSVALTAGTISVTWQVANLGTGGANGNWTDRIYLSDDLAAGNDQLLGTFARSGSLAAGESYTRTESLALPELLDGDHYVVVVTDSENAIYEHLDEDNNILVSQSGVSIVHPDLQVITLSAPVAALSGDSISVDWTVGNAGTGETTATWNDSVYLSGDGTLDASDTLLGEFEHTAGLGVGATYSRQGSVTLPNGISGTYYLLVSADDNAQVAETGSEGNNVTAHEINVTLAPFYDLIVTEVACTSEIVIGSPAEINVSWTVRNQGTGTGVEDRWFDHIFVSKNNVYGDGDDQFVAEFEHVGAIAPGTEYSRSEQVALPSGMSGQFHLFVVADSSNAVYEFSFENNNVTSAPELVSVRPSPFADLVVTGVTVPASGSSGKPFELTWTVLNQGQGQTNTSTWQDRIVLSADTVLGNADDIPLANVTRKGSLASGSSYDRTATVVLPDGVTGEYYVFVQADSADVVDEFLLESNNAERSSTPFSIALSPPPDLTVASIDFPSQAVTTGMISVTWTTTNLGTGDAEIGWTDRVYLSSDDTVGNDTLLGSFFQPATLAAGASRARTENVRLPKLADGDYHIIVISDTNNDVYEHLNEANNTRISAATFAVSHPDLQVTSVVVPSASESGATIPIEWTVSNEGVGATQTSIWNDQIYLSDNDVYDSGDQLLGEHVHEGLLAASGQYVQALNVRLPNGVAGEYYILVRTDTGGYIDENADEGNNVASSAIDISLAPAPDLVVSSIVFPASAISDSQVEISWTLLNQGSAPASGSWTDKIYLSEDAAIGGDELFGSYAFSGTIAPGDSIVRTQTINLPRVFSGDYRVVVHTDAEDDLFEQIVDSNNVSIADSPIAVTLSPFPNLQVAGVSAPPNMFSGQTTSIQWVVSNLGNGPTGDAVWYDTLYLSNDPILDGTDVNLGSSLNASYLDVDESYVNSRTVTIPEGINGEFYFILKTDRTDSVFEHVNEGDNVGVAAPTDVVLVPPPDLRVTAVAPSSSAFSGQSTTVSWTVTNEGEGDTRSTSWTDWIYMSADRELGAGDYFLERVGHGGALGPGESYTANKSVTLPIGVSGQFYFIVTTDALGQVFEHVFGSNNTGSSTKPTTVILTPPPDLEVTLVDAPEVAFAGHSLSVAYQVTNNGATGTPSLTPVWLDRLYISADNIFDADEDILVATKTHTGGLASEASYNNSLSGRLPDGIAGDFFAFVVTDYSNQVFELDNDNNIAFDKLPVGVELQPPDLTVDSISMPKVARAGTPFSVDYRVINDGVGVTTTSRWTDRVYLSSDSVFDPSSDLLLDTLPRFGALNAGQSYTASITKTLPHGLDGSFYVYVYTDFENSVFELNNSNNIQRSSGSVLVESRPADLTVTNLELPLVGGSGRSILATWSVANLGVGDSITTSWYDQLVLSKDTVLGNSDDRTLATVTHSGILDSLSSYTVANRLVQIPFDVSAGNYFVFLTTDYSNRVYEGADEVNNTALPQAISIVRQVPDLYVTEIVSPVEANSGAPITVTWTVRNIGTAATNATYWYDAIYLSANQHVSQGDFRIGYVQHTNTLDIGEQYTATRTFTVPENLQGDYYVIVRADASRSVVEDAYENNNDSVAGHVTAVSLGAVPDLAVVNVDAPSQGIAGQPFHLTWTVQNIGNQEAGQTWFDSVYLSRDPFLDRTADTFVGYRDRPSGLAPGESYTRTTSFDLDWDLSGPHYVFVVTDGNDRVFERNSETNNVGTDLTAMQVLVLPPADLVAGTLSIPANAVPGQEFAVTYTVTNQGVNPALGKLV